ncbi:alpha/beta hydrolase [Candidatus Pacearchaeota archaeon]|nr:alpha/beta hydrolase [Candidatus Pacearchaeota archaeon]
MEKTNYVLLHGYTANPRDDFHPWLRAELEKRGYKVSVPRLPNTFNPHITQQRDYVLKNCQFSPQTILLGHSLGSVVALKVLEELQDPIKRLILVSGFVDSRFQDGEPIESLQETFDWKFDFGKIKRTTSERYILRPKNDSAVSKEQGVRLYASVGGKLVNFVAKKDHACGKREPKLLEVCLS